MKWLKRWGSFSLSLLLFCSCSTKPEYHIHKTYIGGDKKCTEKCEYEKKKCDIKCEKEYKTCIEFAKSEAKKIYRDRQIAYRYEIGRYSRLYEDYLKEYDKWFLRYEVIYDEYSYYRRRCEKDKKDSYACEKSDKLKRELDNLSFLKPSPPVKPKPADFSSIFKNLKKDCDKKCNCEEDFDRCFSLCGGKIKIEKICIKNCKND